MTSTPSFASLAAGRAVLALAESAAWVISLRRPLVHRPLTVDECEEAGLPLGSLDPSPAIHVSPSGLPFWRLGAWIDRDAGPEGCLHIDAFGWEAEVFYKRAAPAVVAA